MFRSPKVYKRISGWKINLFYVTNNMGMLKSMIPLIIQHKCEMGFSFQEMCGLHAT